MLSKFMSCIPQGSRACHFRSREYIDRQRKVNCRMPSRVMTGLHLDSDPCHSQRTLLVNRTFQSSVRPFSRAAAVCERMKRVMEVAWHGGIAATGRDIRWDQTGVWGRKGAYGSHRYSLFVQVCIINYPFISGQCQSAARATCRPS